MRQAVCIVALLCGAATSSLGPRHGKVRAAEVPVTYSRQIAPMVYANCTGCHHAGGAGPFSLMTYAELRRHAPEVLAVTQSRSMPPWLPEPGYGDFSESRRLKDGDRNLLRAWIESGMPEGDLGDAPVAPVYTSAWQLGPPDLVLTVDQAFTTPAAGTDVFRNFILPYPLAEKRYVRAVEILPGTAAAVHHANLLLDRTGSFRRQHPAEWRAGVPGMELVVDAGSRFDPDSHFLFWKPDSPAIEEPAGREWELDAGDDLILNMHLKPTGKPETIQAQVGLYFSKTAPSEHPMLLQLEHDAALDIPANASRFEVTDDLKLPVAVKVLGIYPHAHYLGKEMQAFATLPSGKKQWLVWIRDWDIDRQAVYRYREPVLLPKGTVVHMRYIYDNSTANPRNPHVPPVRVKAGNRSEDEMGHLWLQVLPVEATVNGKDARLVLEEAWMKNRLRKAPDDVMSLYNLASALAEQGKTVEAVGLYRRILARSPGDTRTMTALGAALEGEGEWKDAEGMYRQAVAANPEQNDARWDLAQLEMAHDGELEAIVQLQTLLERTPEDRGGRQELALAYARTGQMEDAARELTKLVALQPRDAVAHATLSQVEAALGQIAPAVAEQETALRLDPKDADGWNNMGVLHTRVGQRNQARQDFERALALVPGHSEARANLERLQADSIR